MGLEYLLFRTGPAHDAALAAGRLREERSGAADARTSSGTCSRSGSTSSASRCIRFPAITPSVCNLRPTSRGHVRIKSPDPLAHPAIRLNYLSTPEDQRVAVDGMRFTRRIMAARALARYAPEEWRPGPAVESDADLLHAAGDLGTTIFHPVGTCRMGPDPMAVVDDRLRVHGVDGLRVIDASVMPRITSGNTNAPTVMIAEKGAEMIRDDTRVRV